ncbi:helix-turn-helix domain-containing protein [Nocardia sp. 348MFTsu5.1]|uniref:helix-turn-helix domain-containing protein n=1 Tax=Nocardia sp. 348MFTsu5.1 TaxID=1172185 RepID=UPI000366A91F|nr:TetR/AcrR family transcriptional regulator [Nocardia sp. 348MFTsu5.1]
MTVTSEGARSRLLTTARKLFAERGLDAVSLREIIREAGVKHATAIQYHFGDREGLIAAILATHEARVDTRREAMLDQYEATGIPDRRTIAAIMVRPLARELEDQDGRHFLRINAQVVQRPPPGGIFVDTGTSMWRWRRQAAEFLPPGAAELHTRYTALTFTTVELARRAGQPQHFDDQLFVSRITDVVSAIVEAPLSPETERLYTERHERHQQRDARRREALTLPQTPSNDRPA